MVATTTNLQMEIDLQVGCAATTFHRCCPIDKTYEHLQWGQICFRSDEKFYFCENVGGCEEVEILVWVLFKGFELHFGWKKKVREEKIIFAEILVYLDFCVKLKFWFFFFFLSSYYMFTYFVNMFMYLVYMCM